MATIVKFDSGANPGVDLNFDDAAVTMELATRDDAGVAAEKVVFTDSLAQSAVDLVRREVAGQIVMDKTVGMIWAIAPDNSSIVTVQRDDDTPLQVALTPAETNVITGWLVSSLPNVHRGT